MGRRKRSAETALQDQCDLSCPLCLQGARSHCRDRRRAYFLCGNCGLIFADPTSLPAVAVEKSYYDMHENDPGDEGYVTFLRRLTDPLLTYLTLGMHGLDYGCGPGPAISGLLSQAGLVVADFDPLYAPDHALLTKTYDFVTCTEVVEHFHRPCQEWDKLQLLVAPGGWLGIMTCLVPDPSPEGFRGWWYKGDPTHVSFYQAQTMLWIGRQWGFSVRHQDDRVIIMQRDRVC